MDNYCYLAEIKKILGDYEYNKVKYLIGLFGLECSFAREDRPKYKETLEKAQNLRYAFIDGCNAQMEADKKYGVI